jgi:hypothetical protein
MKARPRKKLDLGVKGGKILRAPPKTDLAWLKTYFLKGDLFPYPHQDDTALRTPCNFFTFSLPSCRFHFRLFFHSILWCYQKRLFVYLTHYVVYCILPPFCKVCFVYLTSLYSLFVYLTYNNGLPHLFQSHMQFMFLFYFTSHKTNLVLEYLMVCDFYFISPCS